ncbi:trypsin-like peptidase domain-containing protein [[Clostridium] leptum]|nr:trypsin-like peptidase domain-containing protein [[Clostridium] leptum]
MSDDLYDILKEFEEKEKQEAARAQQRKEELLKEENHLHPQKEAEQHLEKEMQSPVPPAQDSVSEPNPPVQPMMSPESSSVKPEQTPPSPPTPPSQDNVQPAQSDAPSSGGNGMPFQGGNGPAQGQSAGQPPYGGQQPGRAGYPHASQGQQTIPPQGQMPPYPPHGGQPYPPQPQRPYGQNPNPYYRQYPQYPYNQNQNRPPYGGQQPGQTGYPHAPQGQPPYPPQNGQPYPPQGQMPYPPQNGQPATPPPEPQRHQPASQPPMPLPKDKEGENSTPNPDGTPPQKKWSMPFRILAIVVGVVFLGSVIGFSILGGYNLAHSGEGNNNAADNGTGNSASSSAPLESPSMDIEDIPGSDDRPQEEGALSPKQVYSQVSPSVVAITSYGADFMSGDSYGSGIIMNEEGYIITNAHVLSNANNVMRVKLLSGEEYEATFIAADSKTDLGIIKIDAPDLQPATFGNSDQLSVGDTVYAIGNPGGPQLESSFSSGMVSGINRKVMIEGNSEMSYIQTDAAINPGNSGGALINAFGQVVGINTAKMSTTSSGTAYEGLGFAIPISQAQPFIDQLIQYGKILNRVKLGASFQVVDETTAALYNLPQGLYVYQIEDDSNLLQAGVQPGDVITHADGQAVTDVDQLKDIIRQKQVGDTVRLTVSRQRRGSTQSQQFEVDVQLIEDVDTSFSQSGSSNQTSPLQ